MAVRIRLKKMGRLHRPFFRVCAMDARSPRGGRVIEELGTYDPMIIETDARTSLNVERIDYWLSVGARPTEKVGVLIKKYGSKGTHLDQQKTARDKMASGAHKPVAVTRPAASPKSEETEEAAATSEPAQAEGTEAQAEAAPESEQSAEG